jgi:hypothetical protein
LQPFAVRVRPVALVFHQSDSPRSPGVHEDLSGMYR